jgi:TniB protein
MTDDLVHLHPAYRPYAVLSTDERIQWTRHDRWISYERAEQILLRLADLLTYPPRDRMPALLIFGATGMGKTRIIQKFLRDHRSDFDEVTGITRLPVAYVQMPPTPAERDFYKELLVAMGAVVPTGLSASTLRHRARVLARQLDVRVLVIDEIHAMLAGTFREQRIFLNALRFLANDLRIPLVCVGTHEAKQALMTDQQLADRFEARELPAWRDDVACQALLASFGAILPLRQPSDLHHPKIQTRILSLCDGVTIRICRLLEAAAIRAIVTGRERIDLELLTDDLATSSLVSIADRRLRRPAG